ncbi:MAG: zf-HC2 domain-containing protein [Rhodoferax sp.]|uniref:anti-sigma factor family protein n=1 Tax=Rhodoferax sp. TaxID=50421 RepID=UPI002ACDBFA6|nr:zf-HC2 domain-containing protein [Rhodoferax sp.]MDZ7890677.1 zf-HC2 domain-containing protein [Rhodoferax sp.]
MTFLRRTCKEAAALMVAREDRILSLDDKVALYFHLMACKTCPRFEKQLLTLRHSMREWRHYRENDIDSAG